MAARTWLSASATPDSAQEQRQARQRIDAFFRARAVRRDASDLDLHGIGALFDVDRELAALPFILAEEGGARRIEPVRDTVQIAVLQRGGGGFRDGVGRRRAGDRGDDGPQASAGSDREEARQASRPFPRRRPDICCRARCYTPAATSRPGNTSSRHRWSPRSLDHEADRSRQRHSALLDGLHRV